MRLNIEIDCTPQELQEVFIPGEKQTEFIKNLVASLSDQMQKSVYKNYPDFMAGMMENLQKNQEQIMKSYFDTLNTKRT